ncbi:MAG: NOB1 family endonuclease [Promethearchaeota archaeon]
MKEKSPVFLFDTNIFLTGIDFSVFKGIVYTTPSVIEEVKFSKYIEKNRNILNKIYAAIESKKLKLQSPKNEYIEKIGAFSKKTGDLKALSNVDKELLALSLELKDKEEKEVIVYSNDYSIENVCAELNINFSPLYKGGIVSKIIWEIYCPFCKEIYTADFYNRICEKCGSKLKRRPNRNKLF